MVKKKRQSDPGENGDDSTESCDEMVKSTCPHITKAVDLTRLRKELRGSGFAKDCSECKKSSLISTDPDFEEDLTLWLCLRCGSQLCGRAKNKHALNHFNTPHSDCHALTVNTTTWSIYCYSCNNEVTATSSKKLHECVEYVKKQSMDHSLKPKAGSSANKPLSPIELILKPAEDSIIKSEPIALKGKEKNPLQRVRGLSNLGNTCFFNSVMQCLVQTPYLMDVLQEMANPGEKFTLPGGKLKLRGGEDDGKEVELPPITGQLGEWGPLTRTLAETLAELKSGEGGVFTPGKLLVALVNKLPQFGGGDQHDSHELLRHLLEAVRSEDLRRYQSVILSSLGMSSKVDPSKVDGEVKQKVKFYGQQASDTMLRPEQVFRGFLVSTLECQECFHHSDRAEYFLDLSLPVAACRPQPPALVRRKTPNEETAYTSHEEKPSKHQLKKERIAARKAARRNKSTSKDDSPSAEANGGGKEESKSSSESDADVEDNLEEATPAPAAHKFPPAAHLESGYSSEKVSSDSVRAAPPPAPAPPAPPPAAIPLGYKPLSSLVSLDNLSNPDSGVASPEATKHNSTETVDNVDSPVNGKEIDSSLSSEMNLDLPSPTKLSPENDLKNSSTDTFARSYTPQDMYATGSYSNEVVALGISVKGSKNLLEHSGESSYESLPDSAKHNDLANDKTHLDIVSKLDKLKLGSAAGGAAGGPAPCPSPRPSPPCPSPEPAPRPRLAPLPARYQPDEDECSVQSCLSQFTALELLTGNNKVGCETCTERTNGKDGKTVYTNATKRFLVSSPPAILILHLKRFQLGPRCMFRKMSKHVDFPTVLDLAPFCAMEKVRKLPNVCRGQGELLYSLYGVVEHSGGMHGGHYVAYVKVRGPVARDDPRWWFLPRSANVPSPAAAAAPAGPAPAPADSDSELSGYESGEGSGPAAPAPPGKWYYVSDSMVSEVSEEKVLRAQAYLLFYERIV